MGNCSLSPLTWTGFLLQIFSYPLSKWIETWKMPNKNQFLNYSWGNNKKIIRTFKDCTVTFYYHTVPINSFCLLPLLIWQNAFYKLLERLRFFVPLSLKIFSTLLPSRVSSFYWRRTLTWNELALIIDDTFVSNSFYFLFTDAFTLFSNGAK